MGWCYISSRLWCCDLSYMKSTCNGETPPSLLNEVNVYLRNRCFHPTLSTKLSQRVPEKSVFKHPTLSAKWCQCVTKKSLISPQPSFWMKLSCSGEISTNTPTVFLYEISVQRRNQCLHPNLLLGWNQRVLEKSNCKINHMV